MIDALLHSVKDAIRTNLNYDPRTCDVMAPPGMPPERSGEVFVAVHQAASESTMDNCKNDLLNFMVTLTMRTRGVPLDRMGDKVLARKLAQDLGFNKRADQLADLLHMDWGVLQDANQYLVDNNPDAVLVYGFCEPARFRGMEDPELVGGDWFGAITESELTKLQGLRASLRFEGARRIQAIASYV